MHIPAADRLGEVKEYYFATKLRELRERANRGENILNLGIGNPDMMPATETIRTLVNSSLEHGKHGYQPYRGIAPLRKGFADWYLNTYGVSLDPEKEVLPLMGSKEALYTFRWLF